MSGRTRTDFRTLTKFARGYWPFPTQDGNDFVYLAAL
jgi:hypothetical protein